MSKRVKRGIIGLGAFVVLAAVLAIAAIYLASEAMIVRRYTLPSSIVHAKVTGQSVAWGRHVATTFGCRDCHGAGLTGRMIYRAPGLYIAAPNLTRFAADHSDAEFDFAVRHGLAPSARALWVMPSQAYVYMRDPDLTAILAYLRRGPPTGAQWPGPEFSLPARIAVLTGSLAPVDPYALGRHPPRSVGPRYDGGRYLAAMACSSCHGTDLTGQGNAPDLRRVAKYSRSAFFALLYSGRALAGHHAPEMAQLAAARFHAFKDYETDALYAYLIQRARTSAKAPAPVSPH
jgi:cytochrome c553